MFHPQNLMTNYCSQEKQERAKDEGKRWGGWVEGGRDVIVFARGSGGAIRVIKLISRTNKGRREE